MHRFVALRPVCGLAILVLSLADPGSMGQTALPSPEKAGAPGGLCVMVGLPDAAPAIDLARTGRYLVHVLSSDAAVVAAGQKAIHQANLYGLASAEALPAGGALPYTENLVNIAFIGDADGAGGVGLRQVARVLRPGGVVFIKESALKGQDLSEAGLEPKELSAPAGWRALQKPWPSTIDGWSHPRHGADGNAVSRDEQTGLPQRIRWIAGPQQEISNFVTAGGRAFFAGVLARDGFNGLKLWDAKLSPNPARGGFNMTLGSAVQPIATDKYLLVWHDKSLQALDGATGAKVRDYPQAGAPIEVLLEGRTVLSIQKDAIVAMDLESARMLWKHPAPAIRAVAAGDGAVYYVQGDPAKPEEIRLVSRDLGNGTPRFAPRSFDWLPKVKRCTYHGGYVACEVSTLNDEKLGNALQMLSAADGSLLWGREFIPGSAHKKQARVLFNAGLAWVLESRKLVGLDPRTGDERRSVKGSNVHCFPPVATTRYLFSGEMDLTDFETGHVQANQITKQACSRDAGVVPANGLLYTFPKHCICWPMLRDYAALAPAVHPIAWSSLRFTPERGTASAPADGVEDPGQWPSYRHDALRSGSTPASVAAGELKVLWTASLGERPEGTIAQDWNDNYYIRGPVGPPVIAGGLVFVTRPDAHQIVALDAVSGSPRWTFTANGRVDTAPTIHKGLCLFGCKSGWVYGLRAADGALVWRLRAAPADERIVAYGQLESPWPVPGSVLVVDGVAYFAAGRHPLADGGVLVFAVEPSTGTVRWMQRLKDVPQKNFYGSSGLEFDNFDLLQQEGACVSMSRWLFDRATGAMTLKWKSGFAELQNGQASVLFPRGSWSYAPRNESEQCKERPFVRPLAVFRDNALFSCSQDRKTLFRREFDATEEFDGEWFAGWKTYKGAREGGDLWRSQRIAHLAKWSVAPFETAAAKQPIQAMILAGQSLCAVSAQGRLAVIDTADGRTQAQLDVGAPAWDSLAAAGGRLFLSTQDGKVVCIGK